MSASVKSQRDKPTPAAHRLSPRPTAASAARAAKNASRNQASAQPTKKQYPSRTTRPSTSESRSPTLQRQENENRPSSASPLEKKQTENDTETASNARASTADIFNNETVSVVSEGKTSVFSEDIRTSERTEEVKITSIPTASRPTTPSESRPTTPSKSRPTTPSKSRPTTPSKSRPTTPSKSLSSSQKASGKLSPSRRPSGLKQPTTINRNVVSPIAEKKASKTTLHEEQDSKSAYIAKQKEFLKMKKELDYKQQSILKLFDYLRNLSERLTQEGKIGSGEGFHSQELVLFNVGDWTAEEVTQLCRNATETANIEMAAEAINTSKPIDQQILEELDSNITKLPTCFAELCLQAFTARQELIDWVKQLLTNVNDESNESIERIAKYNQRGLELCETLRDLKTRADSAVDGVLQFSRQAYQERSRLIAIGETLVREIYRLRQDFEQLSAAQRPEVLDESEIKVALEETQKELEEEKAARAIATKKLTIAESQLRQTQHRVTKMDRQLREAEASIANLTGTVKSLEEQSRQREIQLESRARKLKETLKTNELSTSQLIQQRDHLQEEIKNLKEYTENIQNQNKSTIQELKKEIKDLKNLFDEQRKEYEKEASLRAAAQEKLAANEKLITELKNKNRELELSKANPELPTEREMDLWAELQTTKDTLRLTEEEVTQYKREKVRFLESITKIAETDNKVEMQQKLAAELLSKEEIINNMQAQMREVAKQVKLNEQKVMQYEQYIRDLQAHNRSLIAQGTENTQGLSFQDLQKEILGLRMGLLDANHRNEELAEILSQKEQQLEQQDKTSKTQARVIKVREELINMLKNKEAEQAQEMTALQQDLDQRMKVVEEVNKQIASKAEEIQELFTTLENKQQQIHRLEKIVLALEEQQRRTQAQRTRYEEKIAALEHELAACKSREKKFLFF